MRLPGFKRISTDDFRDQDPGFIEKLAFIVNNGVEVLYQVLNNRVSLADNSFCDIAEIQVKVDSNGIPTSTTRVTLDKLSRSTVLGTRVINAKNLTNQNTYPLSGIFISFSQAGDVITVKHITGLPVGHVFVLTVVLDGL